MTTKTGTNLKKLPTWKNGQEIRLNGEFFRIDREDALGSANAKVRAIYSATDLARNYAGSTDAKVEIAVWKTSRGYRAVVGF